MFTFSFLAFACFLKKEDTDSHTGAPDSEGTGHETADTSPPIQDSEGKDSEDSSSKDTEIHTGDTDYEDTAFEDGLDDKYYRSSSKAGYTQISASQVFSCVINKDGYVECWGYETEKYTFLEPPTDRLFKKISVGMLHGCGILDDNSLLCWGDNSYNQLNAPVDPGGFTQVASGDYGSCALKTSKELVCWGHLENTHIRDEYEFVDMGASGGYCYITSEGKVFCTASDLERGLQHGEVFRSLSISLDSYFSTYVYGITDDYRTLSWNNKSERGEIYGWTIPPEGVEFAQISAGTQNSCGITTKGESLCWGDLIYDPPPVQFVQIESGRGFACGLDTTGRIYCWGDNEYGQTSPP